MASERQIAANRANGGRSRGPKTRAGKERSRTNAYRHGLAAVFNREALAEIEELARQLAGEGADPIILQHARHAAHAVFILDRIKLLRIAWVQRTYELGTVEFPPRSVLRREFLAWLNQDQQGPPRPLMRLPSQTMPPPGPERLAEAIRRALSELAKLDRYEAKAAARRNRAFRALARLHSKERKTQTAQNEPNFL
jgi:hypothetical protein